MAISFADGPQDTVIEVCELTKYYNHVPVLDGVSLSVASGEFVALLGENGAGKTTLMSAVMGLINTDKGSAKVFGHTPGSLSAKRRMGVMLQATALPDKLTVAEQIRLFASYYPNPMSLECVQELAMLDEILERRIGGLSGGQKQRVLFAMAIVGQPDLLLLDEPTVGLDPSARREFWVCVSRLHQNGVTILLTTHYLEEAEALAQRVVMLNQGSVIADSDIDSFKLGVSGAKVRFRTPVNGCETKVRESSRETGHSQISEAQKTGQSQISGVKKSGHSRISPSSAKESGQLGGHPELEGLNTTETGHSELQSLLPNRTIQQVGALIEFVSLEPALDIAKLVAGKVSMTDLSVSSLSLEDVVMHKVQVANEIQHSVDTHNHTLNQGEVA